LEPPAILFGQALALFGACLPRDLSWGLQNAIFRVARGGGEEKEIAFGSSDPVFDEVRRMCRSVEDKTGRRPAVVCLMGHAPVDPESLHLGVELMRHGLLALRAVRDCLPKLVLAIDAFALDMLGVFVEGAYAGFMGPTHLGIDRLPRLHSTIGRWMLSPYSWERYIYRVTSWLRDGGEMLIVPGGGVDSTARIQYTAREAAGALCRQGPNRGDAAGSGWRAMEASVLEPLCEREAFLATEKGELPGIVRARFEDVAGKLGFTAEGVQERTDAFVEEFACDTPYRTRLFSVIAARVLKKGRPVVFFTTKIAGSGSEAQVVYGSPEAWTQAEKDRIEVLASDGSATVESTAAFARRYLRARLGGDDLIDSGPPS